VPEAYFRIDANFKFYVKEFSKAELKTYVVLCMFMDNNSRICYPSLKRLKQITGLAHRHLLNALNKLERKNLIRRDRGKMGKNTNYYIEPVPLYPTGSPFEVPYGIERFKHDWFQ
jgi:DNA-binding MarR family transcriptional regulator